MSVGDPDALEQRLERVERILSLLAAFTEGLSGNMFLTSQSRGVAARVARVLRGG